MRFQIVWDVASEKVLLIWFFPSGDIGRILHKFPLKMMENHDLCVTQMCDPSVGSDQIGVKAEG